MLRPNVGGLQFKRVREDCRLLSRTRKFLVSDHLSKAQIAELLVRITRLRLGVLEPATLKRSQSTCIEPMLKIRSLTTYMCLIDLHFEKLGLI